MDMKKPARRATVRVDVCANCKFLPSLCRCGWPANHARIEAARAAGSTGAAPLAPLAPLTVQVVWR